MGGGKRKSGVPAHLGQISFYCLLVITWLLCWKQKQTPCQNTSGIWYLHRSLWQVKQQKSKKGGKQHHIFINDIKNFKILSSSVRTYLQYIAHWKQIAWLVGKAMLRINKPGKAGLRAAQGTCLGFRAGKPLKLQTANKNTAGMQGSHISSIGFISVLFKLQLTNLRISSQFLLIHN